MREETLVFGTHNTLTGVLTRPDGSISSYPGIILLNAGLIHRIGPNRMYVKLARALAALGFPVLRFDLSGVGDSHVRVDNLPFDRSAIDDAQQAMNHLAQHYGMSQFIMMGHCAGAVNSFRTASQDQRVIAAVLINPEGGDEDWEEFDRKRKLARYYENYYTKGRMTDPQRWVRLLTGRADYRSIFKNVFQNIIWNRVSTTAFQLKSRVTGKSKSDEDPAVKQTLDALASLAHRDIQLLLVYSESSTGLVRMQVLLNNQLRELKDSGKVKLTTVSGADHTFTLAGMQERLVTGILDWSQAFAGQNQPATEVVAG
jgi:pimeloyl-ACP methyl ester carboxylesterase